MQPMLSAKMAVLGEQFVGKSSLAIRWVRDSFSENTEGTIGAAFLTKTVTSGAQQVKLQIWDTAGQERYRSLTPMYYRNAQAAIVVYDVTNHGSFDRAAEWIKELKVRGTLSRFGVRWVSLWFARPIRRPRSWCWLPTSAICNT